MNFGFRYYLASLMAVFLSLFLGILIGAAIFQDGTFVEEQGQRILEMEEHFDHLQLNLATLQKQQNHSKKIAEAMRNVILQDLLVEQRVGLLALNEQGLRNELQALLEQAGAQVDILTKEHFQTDEDLQEEIVVVLFSPEYSSDLRALLELLEKKVQRLVLTWPENVTSVGPDLPATSLQVDSINTIAGQIALILGVAHNKTGHYGQQPGSKGLFP